MLRRLVATIGTALLASLGIAAVIGRLGRDWEARVAVRGHSMEPTLRDGDWLLVDPGAYAHRVPRRGELVVVRDARHRERVLVKRVAAVDGTGASLTIGGDHPAHAEDSVAIGAVESEAVLGRPWFRYWPSDRMGRIG
jgi:signal peptidase I